MPNPEPSASDPFEIFLSSPPGLEPYLLAEVIEQGLGPAKMTGGGVLINGDWTTVWRANLKLRGASKVLVRIGSFRAFHLAQLDKRARKFPWETILTPGLSVKVDVKTNRKSKIYHAGAAVERIERAICEEFDATIAENLDTAEIVFKVRIDDNNVILSIDSSGEGLHKRGHKQAMGKAPMRETMAALLLRACDYDGGCTVLDPMCGSGTFVIEAAEISRGLLAGRGRAFAFEKLASFDRDAFQAMKAERAGLKSHLQFYGSDRNVNVVGYAQENAARAGVDSYCHFSPTQISKLTRPEGQPGLVMVNPPYGARIGKKKDLFSLYGAFGGVMTDKFQGWRVGMVTSDINLAHATKLPWKPMSAPIAHGGLKVRLFQTEPLK